MKFCLYGDIAKGLEGKPIGGGEQQLALIAKSLNQLGHEVIIIDSNEKEDKDINGIKVISLQKRIRNRFFRYSTFYHLLKNTNADVYYARIRSSIHLVALLAARRNNALFIYHLASDLDSLNFRERWLGFYSKLSPVFKAFKHLIHGEILFPYLLKGADMVICQNEEQYNNLNKKRLKKIFVLNNLFDFQKSDVFNANQPRGRYYLYIGSIDLRKGVKELEYLINTNPDELFVIIGRPRDKVGRSIVSKIKNKSNVNYLGQLPHNKVVAVFNEAKALLNTSINEGFSNAFIEAWSFGIPVFSLNSNPSGVIEKYNLGESYDGDLVRMANILSSESYFKYNRDGIISYVEKFHNPLNITIKLIDEIQKKYD